MKKKEKTTLTKKEKMHYIIYRYLDNLDISDPYFHATEILKDLGIK